MKGLLVGMHSHIALLGSFPLFLFGASSIPRRSEQLYEEALEAPTVHVKDNKKNRIAECVLQDGDLYCMMCESPNCVHIGFAWSIPEVYKAMDLHGKKMPKKIE